MAKYRIWDPANYPFGQKVQWLVRKYVGNLIDATYRVTRTKNGFWQCDCGAGRHGRLCKHKRWCQSLVRGNAASVVLAGVDIAYN